MNKYLKAYLNWRINTLCMLAMAATVLIVSESKAFIPFISTKIAGFALAYLTFRLGKYWYNKGKIDELKELVNEE